MAVFSCMRNADMRMPWHGVGDLGNTHRRVGDRRVAGLIMTASDRCVDLG